MNDAPDEVRVEREAENDPSDSSDDGSEESSVEVLEHDLEQLISEREELRGLAQRVQADFENYRKRVLREQTALAERASAHLVEQLLPVLDNFELALASLDDASDKLRKGVELVYADLVATLERAGLERIVTDGVPFDPNEHDAVLQEEGGEGEPIVTETMRPGYRLKGKVLRPAMVKVARA